ncbi:MAG: hypothetical protein AAFR17_17590 [Pseudomonadota bacterium]
MLQFTSTTSPLALQVIGVLAAKLIALALAVSLSEQRGRDLVPVVAVIYAVALPVALALMAP